jgi:hypothetical protein
VVASAQQTASTAAEAFAEMERLSRANADRRDPALDRRILRLRHRAGAAMTAEARGSAPRPFPEPALDRLPERTGRDLPEFSPADLDAELLRAAILRDGCMLIRGLVDRERAEELARGIDRSFAERSSGASGGPSSEAYYEELALDAPNPQLDNLRGWIQSGGGVLAADSPRLAFDMFQIFEAVGLRDAIGGYLGERPAISVEKCTLRKAEPSVAGAWHQDGAFMGDVRSLNVWLSLSRCGDEAPGLDLVPRRLDELVPTGGDEVMFDNQISQATAERAAGDLGIARPIFEPGDALLFDDLFLHRTASDPSMPKPRFAVESWFFAPSAFPEDYAPLAS